MTDLRSRLSSDEILVVPGVYDALTAALAAQTGFEAVFLSGSAVSYSQLARPDIGLVTMTEMVQSLDRIRDRVDLHVFVDGDSGYGNALNVGRTVRAFERAGASGVQLEDQINTKAMDQVGQRPLVSKGTMIGKIKAALDSRTSERTLISARSDAMFSEGVDAAIDRAALYAEAGADIVFVEGIREAADRARLCNQLKDKLPLLYNLMKPGADGSPTTEDLSAEGYSIVLCPGVVIGAAANAAKQALLQLSGKEGATEPQSMAELIEAEAYLKG